MDPEERYERLVDAFAERADRGGPGRPGAFGADALKIDNRMFAMLVRGRLVVKLPRSVVHDLVASGAGTRFDANRGRPMKEWVCLTSETWCDWLRYAEEAFRFVGGHGS
jgi:hypothetical protein